MRASWVRLCHSLPTDTTHLLIYRRVCAVLSDWESVCEKVHNTSSERIHLEPVRSPWEIEGTISNLNSLDRSWGLFQQSMDSLHALRLGRMINSATRQNNSPRTQGLRQSSFIAIHQLRNSYQLLAPSYSGVHRFTQKWRLWLRCSCSDAIQASIIYQVKHGIPPDQNRGTLFCWQQPRQSSEHMFKTAHQLTTCWKGDLCISSEAKPLQRPDSSRYNVIETPKTTIASARIILDIKVIDYNTSWDKHIKGCDQ